MRKAIDYLLILFLILAPYFYLPHLLMGSSPVLGKDIVFELKMLAIIRDGLMVIVPLFYILILFRKFINIPSIFFIIYSVIVSLRLILHGYSNNFLSNIISDSHYILSIFMILVFFLAEFNDKKINIIKKCIKLATIPLFIFLLWEISNPNYAVWLAFERYRSTLLSPTVLGEFSGFIFIIAIFDFFYLKKYKLLNLMAAFLATILIYYSGSRTTLLVVAATFIILFIMVKDNYKKKYTLFFVGLFAFIIVICLAYPDIKQILSTRIFNINISDDARLSGLIYEWNHITIFNCFFGSIPDEIAPIDISWFVIFKSLGILGFLSFFILNITIIYFLIRRLRNTQSNYNKYIFIFSLVFMSFCYLFTTNLMNDFPLNLFYYFGLGNGMNYLQSNLTINKLTEEG